MVSVGRVFMVRFSLRSLFAVTAFIAIGLTALTHANRVWAAALTGGVVLSLSSATLAAVYRSGSSRALWLGFSLFGWIYLVLAHGPFREIPLPTSFAFEYLEHRLGLLPIPPPLAQEGSLFPPEATFDPYFSLRGFENVGHALFTLTLAAVGGVLGRILHATQRPTGTDSTQLPTQDDR